VPKVNSIFKIIFEQKNCLKCEQRYLLMF